MNHEFKYYKCENDIVGLPEYPFQYWEEKEGEGFDYGLWRNELAYWQCVRKARIFRIPAPQYGEYGKNGKDEYFFANDAAKKLLKKLGIIKKGHKFRWAIEGMSLCCRDKSGSTVIEISKT